MAPVHEAAKWDDVAVLARLLDDDPWWIEAEDPFTPLFYAAQAGSLEAARLLLDRGAMVNKQDELGWTPLWCACYYGLVEMAALLLQRGADPSIHAQDKTALMAASYGIEHPGADHVAVIRLLLGRVPVDARDESGCTALWWACFCGHTDRARVLLVEGLACHSIASAHGYTAMATALCRGQQDCVRLMQWYESEGELEKTYLLSKARAVVDATHSIARAPAVVGATTEAEAQKAREEAAPAYLRGRVERGMPLPVLIAGGGASQFFFYSNAEERHAVCEWLARGVAEDLFVEVMEGLRYR